MSTKKSIKNFARLVRCTESGGCPFFEASACTGVCKGCHASGASACPLFVSMYASYYHTGVIPRRPCVVHA